MNKGVTLFMCLLHIAITDSYYLYGFLKCDFSSEDGHDALYTAEVYYNKQLMGSYSSKEGKFKGYNEKLKNITDGFNRNHYLLEEQRNNLQKCIEGIPSLLTMSETAVQKPKVRVLSTKAANSHQPGIIICSAYNFYPKPINLTWLRNGEEVTSDVIITDEMSNGNWLYQKHSYLEYTPTVADTIHCKVEHASLSTPELHQWEYFSESRRTKITVGTAGLILALVFITVGLIYYKKNSRGHLLVPEHSEEDERRRGNQ